jgi:phosphatidylglycerophosphate synthase
MLKRLPNLISSMRLVAAAAMAVVTAAAESRAWFLSLLALALVSDALDGFLARRLKAESELGRKLDSWGDYAVVTAVAYGLWMLWPDMVHREAAWLITGFTACFAIVIYGLVRWQRILAYHTLASKAFAVMLPVALALLLADWSAVPFHLVVVVQVVAAAEELAIAVVLPGYSGQVPSLRHALRQRRQGPPSQA